MALSPFTVRVQREPGTSFGDAMNEIRAWLDHCKIEPASFKTLANASSGVAFEIAFTSEEEAHRFMRDFA